MSTSDGSLPIMAIGINEQIQSEEAMPSTRQFVYIGPFQWQEVPAITLPARSMSVPPPPDAPGPGRLSSIMH